ncbi:MAG: hypothetical protein QXX30_03635 [Candidatus Aenigmatarchaeota archaeon]
MNLNFNVKNFRVKIGGFIALGDYREYDTEAEIYIDPSTNTLIVKSHIPFDLVCDIMEKSHKPSLTHP